MTNKVQVDMNLLDDFGLPGCDLLKVDVEGMEYDVLSGGVNLIEQYKPILYVEIDRPGARERIVEFATDMGYECWQHFPKLFSEESYHKTQLGLARENVFGDVVSANLLAFHKDSSLNREDFSDFDLFPGDVKITICN